MNKGVINELLEIYDVNLIEQHLIYAFIQNNGLDYTLSPVLSKLLQEFKLQSDIYLLISSVEVNELKELESFLELLIPKDDRKVNGAFFTPDYVVDFIVNEVSPGEEDKCLDPSCGCGAFLIGLVEYFGKRYHKRIKQTIRENIYGSDILEYNVERSKIILSIYGLLNNQIIDESDFNIYHQDSLKARWEGKFDVIVGNPPYVRYQDLSDENRSFLIHNWETVGNGSFNIYFAFFELGYKLLKPNGKLGYITPNNYFTSLAALPLRRYFSQKKCLTKIVDFSHKKIFDAQTYTALTFMCRQKSEDILYDRIDDNQSIDEFLGSVSTSPNPVENLNVKKWRLLKSKEHQNIKIIENSGPTIGQLFNISVGIATLKDEVFFVDSSNEVNGLLGKETDKGFFWIEKEITRPVYKISNFKNQEEIEENTLRIITPYNIKGKSAVPILEEAFQREYPFCYAYLLSEKEKLNGRDKGKVNYSPFYVWGRTQGISRVGSKILNPTFSKHPRFLYVPEKDAYFTNGYGLYFKNSDPMSHSLFEELTHPLALEKNVLLLQKVLNSIVMDYYVKKTSVSIQGGFPCYQKNFIENFTIPSFSDDDLLVLGSLTDRHRIDEFLIEKYQLNIPMPKRFSYTSNKVLVKP